MPNPSPTKQSLTSCTKARPNYALSSGWPPAINPPIHQSTLQHPASSIQNRGLPPSSIQYPASRHPSTPLIPLVPRPVASALSRCVWRHVDRLHHRSENLLLRNEADLASVYIDDGEVCSFIETIPDPGGNPYENLVHKETDAEFEALKAQFREFLGREKRLKSLFNCCVNGIWQPRDLASRLHLSASATRNLQKRLKRRVHEFLEQQSHAE
jgi:hypothetical protein